MRGRSLLSLLVVGAAFWLLNNLTWLYADDYSYAFVFGPNGSIDLSDPITLADLPHSQYNHYMAKNGRTVVHTLHQLFLCTHGKLLFNVCNTLVFMAFVYMLQVVSNKRSTATTWCIAAAIFLLSRSFGQVYLWQSGAFNYLWSGLANLLLLHAFFRNRRSDKLTTALGLLLAAVLVGWMHESISIGMTALLAAMVFIDWRHDGRPHLVGMLTTCGYLVGTLFILLSPGTLSRAAASGTDLAYMVSHLGFGAINILTNLRIFWVAVFVAVLLVVRKRMTVSALLHEHAFLLLAMTAQALFLMPLGRVVEPRALFGIELFALILLLRMLPMPTVRMGIIAAIVWTMTYLPALHIIWQNHLDTRSFHEEMMHSDEAVFYDIPEYRGMKRHYVGSRIDLDHHRTAFNREFATFYGRSGVLVLPSRYKQELYLSRAFLTPQHECQPGEYTDDDITFRVIPLPADQPLPPSTLDHEYVRFPSGNYLLRDEQPFIQDGNVQVRAKAKRRKH